MDFSKAKKGDIFLYHGTKHPLIKAINHFDDAYYSHAALYVGNERVQHSNKKGVHETHFKNSAKKHCFMFKVQLIPS